MLSDLRYIVRSLAKRPGYTLVAVLTFALGIGATTSVFSVVEGVLLRSLPFPHADRLVDIRSIENESERLRGGQVSAFRLFEIWRDAKTDFEDMAATTWFDEAVLTGLGPAERVHAPTVTANFFTMLGATAAFGRLFGPSDDQPGTAPIAVVSHRFWMSYLGGDPRAIGRVLALDSLRYTVVGVTNPVFQSSVGPQANMDMWLALGTRLSRPEEKNRFDVDVIGRLRPGVTLEHARRRLDEMASRRWIPIPEVRGQGVLAVITPLQDAYVSHYRQPLRLMLLAVVLVLLITCANVSALLVSRAVDRGPEMAVRLALGAGRRRVLLHALGEAVAVSVAGGLAGLLLAIWLVPFLVAQAGRELPTAASISIDGRVLAVTIGVSLLAGALSGLAPAVLVSGERIADLLKASAGPGWLKRVPPVRANDGSLVVQVGLTLALLVAAGLMGRSFLRIVRVDLGFEPAHLLRAQLELPDSRYHGAAQRGAFIDRLIDEVRALPGVTGVALASAAPLLGGVGGRVLVPGLAEAPPNSWPFGVTAEYFRTMGMRLVLGTNVRDAADSHGVVIDETAADMFFPGLNPLGREIEIVFGRTEKWRGTVVGVVSGSTKMGLGEPPLGVVYYPLMSRPWNFVIVELRARGSPGDLKLPLREAIQRVDRTLAVENVTTMTDWLSYLWARQRFYGLVLALFAAFGLALAAAGIFGSASFAVARRTRELGVRIALGAEPRSVIALILGRIMRVAVVGGALGLVTALATTRVLSNMLFEVEPTDPVVLVSVTGLLWVVCLVASYLPARRAATVDPILALRAE